MRRKKILSKNGHFNIALEAADNEMVGFKHLYSLNLFQANEACIEVKTCSNISERKINGNSVPFHEHALRAF